MPVTTQAQGRAGLAGPMADTGQRHAQRRGRPLTCLPRDILSSHTLVRPPLRVRGPRLPLERPPFSRHCCPARPETPPGAARWRP